MPPGIYKRTKEGRKNMSKSAKARKRESPDWREMYVVDDSGCWLWSGAIDVLGYARINDKGRHRAHRYVYERVRGKVEKPLQLDHLCRVKHCVNPSHLEPVSNQVNTQRGMKAKLNPDKVRLIRRMKDETDATVREIAGFFGVTKSTTFDVLNGKSWSNIK